MNILNSTGLSTDPWGYSCPRSHATWTRYQGADQFMPPLQLFGNKQAIAQLPEKLMGALRSGMSGCSLIWVLEESPLTRTASAFKLQLPKEHHPPEMSRLVQAHVDLHPQKQPVAKQGTTGQMCCAKEIDNSLLSRLSLSVHTPPLTPKPTGLLSSK